MCHRKVMQMRYSRTRSRQRANNYQTLKFGDVADTTSDVYDIWGPNEGYASGGGVQTQYSSGPISMSASGVATYNAGGRVWYQETPLFDKSKSYESAILTAVLADCQQRRMNLLSGVSAPYLLIDSSETMTDIVTSDFKERQARGEIISSPMSSEYFLAESSILNGGSGFTTPVVTWTDHGKVKHSSNLYYQTHHSLMIQFGAHFSAFGVPANMLALLMSDMNMSYISGVNAINESHQRVYEAEADLALFILEANKTFSHLGMTAMRIASIVKKIKRGDFASLAPKAFKLFKESKAKGLSSSADIFLDAWLEARYAWRPLLIDAQNAIDYLNKTSSSLRRTFRSYEDEVPDLSSYEFTSSTATHSYRFYGSLTTEKSVRAGVLTQIDPDLTESRALGALNPAGLLWELIPYSFVVDWFVDVSGQLASMNPSTWFKILTSWASYSTDVTFVGFVDITNSSTSEEKTVPFRLSQKRRMREIDTSPSSVNFDVNLDIFKLVDGVALLRRFKH